MIVTAAASLSKHQYLVRLPTPTSTFNSPFLYLNHISLTSSSYQSSERLQVQHPTLETFQPQQHHQNTLPSAEHLTRFSNAKERSSRTSRHTHASGLRRPGFRSCLYDHEHAKERSESPAKWWDVGPSQEQLASSELFVLGYMRGGMQMRNCEEDQASWASISWSERLW